LGIGCGMNKPLIHLNSVSVHLPIYGVGKQVLKKELVRIATGGFLKKDAHRVLIVNALNNISIDIPDGTRLGLIGHNGAGKTTFLRTISGIYEPTLGQAVIRGKVNALLDVMLGSDEESTGYENIMLRGFLQGLNRDQINAKKEEIATFTELGDYLLMPIRTYSSGMKVRLAFGIATSMESEILAIDEVVGTGDAAFMEKARERFQQMISSSRIVVLASHDMTTIKDICNRVLYLHAGEARFYGDVDEGIAMYTADIQR